MDTMIETKVLGKRVERDEELDEVSLLAKKHHHEYKQLLTKQRLKPDFSLLHTGTAAMLSRSEERPEQKPRKWPQQQALPSSSKVARSDDKEHPFPFPRHAANREPSTASVSHQTEHSHLHIPSQPLSHWPPLQHEQRQDLAPLVSSEKAVALDFESTDFGDLTFAGDGPDVLENFDFDSFLHNTDDSNTFGNFDFMNIGMLSSDLIIRDDLW
jgi:hypothetical protein